MTNLLKHALALVALGCSLVFAGGAFAQAAQPPSEQEQQLVAPIALYPDSLVAQILAASTNPTEIVEAWRWVQQHPGLQGQALADAVDSQPWDPSVKALTQFPSVLDNMNENLSWTSALGDAYVNTPQEVLDAVQGLRQQAQAAGRLQSTDHQTVSTQDQAIAIDPVDPDLVYVPAYDPWLVYGDPMAAYPGWIGVPGIFYAGPDLYFDAGIGIFAGAAWGWHRWGVDWHRRRMTYHDAPYVSHGRTFANRQAFDRRGAHVDTGAANPGRAPVFHAGVPGRTPVFRQPAGMPVAHASAFSGFDRGGVVRGYSDRGRSSFGGGFHEGAAFAGGAHGGGGFAGGGVHGGAGAGRR